MKLIEEYRGTTHLSIENCKNNLQISANSKIRDGKLPNLNLVFDEGTDREVNFAMTAGGKFRMYMSSAVKITVKGKIVSDIARTRIEYKITPDVLVFFMYFTGLLIIPLISLQYSLALSILGVLVVLSGIVGEYANHSELKQDISLLLAQTLYLRVDK